MPFTNNIIFTFVRKIISSNYLFARFVFFFFFQTLYKIFPLSINKSIKIYLFYSLFWQEKFTILEIFIKSINETRKKKTNFSKRTNNIIHGLGFYFKKIFFFFVSCFGEANERMRCWGGLKLHINVSSLHRHAHGSGVSPSSPTHIHVHIII